MVVDGQDARLERPVFGFRDVEALSSSDRALLAGWLAQSTRAEDLTPPARARRRVGLALMTSAALFLVPWIIVLSTTLPDRHASHQWRLAWSGFDVVLTLAFAAAAWLGWRRRQLAITALVVLGVLLLCDAWFDVTLSWGTSEQAASIATSMLGELPVAVAAFWFAHRLLREVTHYVWRLEGRDHPVPRLSRLPMIFLQARDTEA